MLLYWLLDVVGYSVLALLLWLLDLGLGVCCAFVGFRV